MPGFTPINAPQLVKSGLPTSTSSVVDENVLKATTTSEKPRRPSQNTAVPIDRLDSAAVDTALRRNGVRKAATRGKRRIRQTSDEPSSKRRKSSNTTMALPIKKAGASPTGASNRNTGVSHPEKHLSSEIEAASAASRAKLSAYRHETDISLTDQHDFDVPNHTRPVPVYAQQTSMDTVPEFQVQTTMQALQHTSTGGSTPYSSATPHGVPGESSSDARPWLDVVVKQPPATANTRVLRPKEGQSRSKELLSTQLQTPPKSDPESSHTIPDDDATKAKTGQRVAGARPKLRTKSDEEFAVLDDEDEMELMDLTASVEATVGSAKTLPPRDRKQNMRNVHEYEDYGGALFSESEKAILERLRTIKPTRQPVVRTPFPPPVLDRSPLFGVSSTTTLRTCFRVGEALNAGCSAIRASKTVVLELYARVTASYREPKPSRKQHLVVKDMYHDKPPFLNGVFELWDQSALWELDSRPFLSANDNGILCRMVARMKRDGSNWRLEILSIWQADWDDVEHVARIYAKTPVQDDG